MSRLKSATTRLRRWAQEPYSSPADERSGTRYVSTPPPDPVTAAGLIVVFAGMAIMPLRLLGVWTADPLWGLAVFGAGVAVIVAGAAMRRLRAGAAMRRLRAGGPMSQQGVDADMPHVETEDGRPHA